MPHATWQQLAAAAPDVELVPIEGWVEADRATKEPAELERIAAACAVADRALAALLPEIRPGVTEADLALRLEWSMRTGGAEALAFDVACLAGPEAALPHGAPGDRPVLDGAVLLFDFGAQVAGYRSDMTRTLFVGEPSDARPGRSTSSSPGPDGGDRRARGRAVRGHGALPVGPRGRRGRPRQSSRRPATASTSGTASATGSAWRPTRRRRSGKRAAEAPLPSPTVFSVEPGVYLDGETGVRIEDLVVDRRGRRPARAAHAVPDARSWSSARALSPRRSTRGSPSGRRRTTGTSAS